MLSKIFPFYIIFAILFVPFELVISKGSNVALALLPFCSVFLILGIRLIVDELKITDDDIENKNNKGILIFVGVLFSLSGGIPTLICISFLLDLTLIQDLFINHITLLISAVFIIVGLVAIIFIITKYLVFTRSVTVEAKCISKDTTEEDGEPITKLIFEYKYNGKKYKYTDDYYTEQNNGVNLGDTILLNIDKDNPRKLVKQFNGLIVIPFIFSIMLIGAMLGLFIRELNSLY